jgi:hypothetical protein
MREFLSLIVSAPFFFAGMALFGSGLFSDSTPNLIFRLVGGLILMFVALAIGSKIARN